jgi:hypothetical protein
MPEEREVLKSMNEDDRPEVEGHLGAARSDEGGGEEGESLGAARNEGSG